VTEAWNSNRSETAKENKLKQVPKTGVGQASKQVTSRHDASVWGQVQEETE